MERSEDKRIDEVVVKEKSTIFEKNPTDYQKAINAASFGLCMSNPSLLFEKKGVLLEMAREKVHDSGYCYKKGHSRSKKFEPSFSEESESRPKRKKIGTDERQRRMKEVNEEISGLNRHIEIKEQRIEQAKASRNFRMCDDLQGEISELKSQRRTLSAELGDLQHRAKKANEHKKRKKATEEDDKEESDADQSFHQCLPTPM